MRKREITTTGKIDNKGRLRIYMDDINEFFSNWKNSNVIVNFTIVPSEKTKALRGYYYGVVVPSFKRAFWECGERMADSVCESRLRSMSPIMFKETVDIETGNYHIDLREISDLSIDELIEHIETLKQIAAEKFYFYIEDPNIFNYGRI